MLVRNTNKDYALNTVTASIDSVYSEVNDRVQRSRNIIVHNIPENQSQVSQEDIIKIKYNYLTFLLS